MKYMTDSITNQLDIALRAMIHPPLSKSMSVLISDFTLDSGGSVNKTFATLFDHNDFVKQLMVELPHVPRERFNRPIITYLPSDHLVSNLELFALMKRLGVKETLKHEMRSDADWAGLLDAYDKEGGWEGELPGYIIVNTGAHFSPAQIHPSTDGQLQEAYKATV